jgi:hypothetical protein
MKANWCGTHTEQKLSKMGYLTAQERPSCWNCSNHEGKCLPNGAQSLRCKIADTTTTRNAICNEWVKA